MKTNILLSFLVMFAVVVANGQTTPAQRQAPTVESIAQRESEWMKTELKLTNEQATKVDAMNIKYAKQQMSLLESSGGDRAAVQTQMTDLNTKKRSELQSVLSADQLKRYDEYLVQRQQNRGTQGAPPVQ